jgi:hypothetical protein
MELRMKFARTSIVLAAIVALGSGMRPQSATAATAEATPQPNKSAIVSAGRLFQAGKLADAGQLYSQIVAQNLATPG